MLLSVPLGVAMALFINEYAPARMRPALTSMIDLLAALPSLIFGMWALFALKDHLVPVSRFLGQHLSVLPFFKVDNGSTLVGSSFIAGVVVALMVIPIITSVTRDVMAQAPREQCEGRVGARRNAMGDDPRGHLALLAHRASSGRRCLASVARSVRRSRWRSSSVRQPST